ncbi:hypothetical protein M2T82_17560 [Elizabethkingia ursingii]|uniref:hypothetical protein n=1 Tax=Elizabethkingia ursingii TaxID=1756150 RepID=UPI002011D2D7|nr:hypothetical protein [Elizabethkingia ursingii]MCL1669870.1 hypothetical protein [Elizabethkingia ursingii]
MKKTEEMTEEKFIKGLKKKEYIAPKIECVSVIMEQGIATGSVSTSTIKPTNKDGDIYEGWGNNEQSGDITWD